MPCAYVETVIPASEYARYKSAIRKLRHPEDPPPVLIQPEDVHALGDPHASHINVSTYVESRAHEKLTMVKGFKLWRPVFEDTLLHSLHGQSVSACFHMVLRREDGTYMDVTAPDEGDAGKAYIFVPSSRVYQGVSEEAIKHLVDGGFDPLVGMVCMPEGWAKQKAEDMLLPGGGVHVHEVDRLHLVVRPLLSRMPREVRDRLDVLLERGATFCIAIPDKFIMRLADFVDALQATMTDPVGDTSPA